MQTDIWLVAVFLWWSESQDAGRYSPWQEVMSVSQTQEILKNNNSNDKKKKQLSAINPPWRAATETLCK